MRYRRKNVDVEAIQFTGDNILEVQSFVGVVPNHDNTFAFRRFKSALEEWPADEPVAKLWVQANLTWLPIVVGEWILKDDIGFYPCKDEAFQKGYVLPEDSTIQAPTKPGFYRYSGGNQNMIFLLAELGQWWVIFENADLHKCEWGYIEQALSVWDLIPIAEDEMFSKRQEV